MLGELLTACHCGAGSQGSLGERGGLSCGQGRGLSFLALLLLSFMTTNGLPTISNLDFLLCEVQVTRTCLPPLVELMGG